MEEGTLKTPIPKCCLYWSFVWGDFVGSESGQKQSVNFLQNMYILLDTPAHDPQNMAGCSKGVHENEQLLVSRKSTRTNSVHA
jgi:hypothetical protein